jgi:hypothetical protein
MELAITLSSSFITLHPPQHVLMLEVRHNDKAIVKILHASGREEPGEFALLWQSSDMASALTHVPTSRPSFIPQMFLDMVPVIQELELSHLPPDYRAIPHEAANVRFQPGVRYSVVVLSEILAQVEVIGE